MRYGEETHEERSDRFEINSRGVEATSGHATLPSIFRFFVRCSGDMQHYALSLTCAIIS